MKPISSLPCDVSVGELHIPGGQDRPHEVVNASSSTLNHFRCFCVHVEYGRTTVRTHSLLCPSRHPRYHPQKQDRRFPDVSVLRRKRHGGRLASCPPRKQGRRAGPGSWSQRPLRVTAQGRITPGDLGLWSDRQIEPLARIARFLSRLGAVTGSSWRMPAGKQPTPPWARKSLEGRGMGNGFRERDPVRGG